MTTTTTPNGSTCPSAPETTDPRCRHCGREKVNRPRGLCWSCYYKPGVRDLYPSTSQFARLGVADFNGTTPLPEPTQARPGSPEKIAELQRRATAGQSLFHKGGDVDAEGRVPPPEPKPQACAPPQPRYGTGPRAKPANGPPPADVPAVEQRLDKLCNELAVLRTMIAVLVRRMDEGTTDGPDRLVDAEHVARQLGCSRRTLWRRLKQGKAPQPVARGRGSPSLWRQGDVDAWLEQLGQT